MSVENNVPEIRFNGFSGEWQSKTIAELIDEELIYPPKDGNHGNIHPKATDYVKYGIPFIMANNIRGGKIQFHDCYHISLDQAETLQKGFAKTGDVLLTHKGTVGEVAVVPETGLPYLMLTPQVTYYRTCETSGLDTYFLATSFVTNSFQAPLKQEAGGGTRAYLGITAQQKLSISVPPEFDEQTAIGNTFQKLDNLINQHQQKHDKLSSIKKSMLEKMFPKQGETIPEIRFKGFSGGWKVKPFGVCFANIPNNTLSRADLNYEAGLAKNIHYGDVLIKFGEVLDLREETLPFISSDDVANKLKHATLKNGDIIIADAAEDNMVGKCTELFNVDDQIVLSGLHTIAVRPTLSFASKYLGYYLNSSSYHDQLLSLMQGTKVLSISKTAIQNTYVVFPNNMEEQVAIGNYFQKLDALINQHQQQIIKLNNIKQACLSKMFV